MANRTKEENRIYQARWREKNRAKCRQKSLEYFNRKRQDPEWYAAHLERARKHRKANPDYNKERIRKYRKENPDRYAVYNIRKNYKVSLSEAGQLFERKKQGCEACGSHVGVSIDHSHASGIVRFILCRHCNLAIGHALESPKRLRKLASMLEQFQRRHQ